MVNPRQRRKARASAHKTVKHSRHAKRNLKKMKPIRGPKALQDAWDKKKTLRQNYAAMGLVGSLRQTDSGGSECPLSTLLTMPPGEAGTLVESKDESARQQFGKIIRDADGNVTGFEILEERSGSDENGPKAKEEDECKSEVVKTLETLSKSSTAVKRFSSSGEAASLRELIEKHGFNFEAMEKDRRLNRWQRTAGQLERASKKAGLV